MRDALGLELGVEALQEFRAVVGEHVAHLARQQRLQAAQAG